MSTEIGVRRVRDPRLFQQSLAMIQNEMDSINMEVDRAGYSAELEKRFNACKEAIIKIAPFIYLSQDAQDILLCQRLASRISPLNIKMCNLAAVWGKKIRTLEGLVSLIILIGLFVLTHHL